MLASDWRDADQRPSTSPLLYVAEGQTFELVLDVPGLGKIHMKGKEMLEDPLGRVEVVSCSLGA
jgi:hypothetical protein